MHYIIATSLFYYINGHCFQFAKNHKKYTPSMLNNYVNCDFFHPIFMDWSLWEMH